MAQDTMYERLLDQDSKQVIVQQGESLTIQVVFYDMSSTPAQLTEADIKTLTLTLFALAGAAGSLINDRDGQSVKDAAGGTLAADGTLTMKLDALDHVIKASGLASEQSEVHVARFEWTWDDGGTIDRTGIIEVAYEVKKKVIPT